MTFRFSLEPVLLVREHKEKQQRQKLAREMKRKQSLAEQKEAIAAELEDFLGQKDLHKVHDIRKLKNSYSHLEHAHNAMGKLDRDIKKADKAISRERDKLVVAHRETHIMEKVEEREYAVYRTELERAEQKVMDEIATRTFNR
jgi:flagellar protein FliJ